MELLIQNISKTYTNGVKALDQLNLNLAVGMFGLLGANGAGKSSLMRTIATLQFPDEGQVIFNGNDIFTNKTEFRKQLGYLPQDFGVYPKETAERLLDYFAMLKGITSKKDRNIVVHRVLEITNLSEFRKKRVSTFSGGMKQRFGIAQLLLNQPKVIIVDEPTAGLDPSERSRFLNVLRNIGSSNIVIFSTHLVEDVRELCSEMAIINKGKLLSNLSPKKAILQLEGKIWETTSDSDSSQTLPADFTKLSTHYNDANDLVIRAYANEKPSNLFTARNPKLEDYYFLTQKQSS